MEQIRLVIIDDEKPIVNLIKALVPWTSIGIEVAGEAYNGDDALSLIRDTGPDIVITDIMMPGMNGLDLIGETHRLYPQTEFIIISGYREFDYAQTAIRSGVENYLLKPIDRDELVSTLKRLRSVILSERRKDEQLRQSDEERESRRLELLLREGGEDERRPLLAIKVDSESLYLSPEELRVICDRVKAMLNKSRITCPLCMIDDIIFILLSDGFDKTSVLEAVSYFLRDLHGLFPRMIFSIFLSTEGDGKSLKDSYENIKRCLSLRYVEKGVITVRPLPIELDRRLLDDWAVSSVRMLDSFSRSVIASSLDSFEKRVDKGYPLFTMIANAGRILFAKAEAIGLDGGRWYVEKFMPSISIAPDTGSLLMRFRLLIMTYLIRTSEEKANEERRPIRTAIGYMSDHFMDVDFSLEKVSMIAGFSPTYFSQLFRKETGKGFQDFLLEIKIQKAKEMLRDTRKTVHEIARDVGYADTKHFSKTFQKKTGVKPNEFRKLYG